MSHRAIRQRKFDGEGGQGARKPIEHTVKLQRRAKKSLEARYVSWPSVGEMDCLR